MAESKNSFCVRLIVLNAQRQPLGGKVDVELKADFFGKAIIVKGASAAREIVLEARFPGFYHLLVTPTDVFKPVSRTVFLSPMRCSTVTPG